MWKICRGKLRNLANWPAEFGKICHGKLWSLFIRTLFMSVHCHAGVSIHCCTRCPYPPVLPFGLMVSTCMWTPQNFPFGLMVSTCMWTPQNLFSVTEHICLYCLKCTKFGYLDLGKFIKIVDTSCQIWRLIYTKFDFSWGSTQPPLEELTALPQTLWLDLRGSTSKRKSGSKGRGR